MADPEECRQALRGYAAKFLVPTISGPEVIKGLAQGKDFLLIDVREDSEMAVSMIEGAITKKAFEDGMDDKYSVSACASTTLIPYCTLGYRSGKYGEELLKLGYQSVRNGEGVCMWTHDVGRGLVRRGKEVSAVHVYAPPFNYAARGYKTVQFGAWDFIGKAFSELRTRCLECCCPSTATLDKDV